jgi:uncharacterized membrane protein YgcG
MAIATPRLHRKLRALPLAVCAALLCAPAARAGDSAAPAIIHTPVTKAPPGLLKIAARITDDSKIFPQLFFRYGQSGAFDAPVDLKKVKGSKDQYEATVAARAGLQYYLECYDEYGNGPARAGSPESPIKVEVEGDASASAQQPPHAAPWLKGAGGTEGDPRKPATPGSLDLPAAAVGDLPMAPAKPGPGESAPGSASGTSGPSSTSSTSSASGTNGMSSASSTSSSGAGSASSGGGSSSANGSSGVGVSSSAASSSAEHEGSRDRALSTTLPAPAPWTAAQAFEHSLLVPGWGQWGTERRLRGVAFGVATGAALVTALVLTARAQQAENIYESAPPSVRSEAQNQALSYAHTRNFFFGLTAALWAVNAAEACLGYGSKDAW